MTESRDEIVNAEVEPLPVHEESPPAVQSLRLNAAQLASGLSWVPGHRDSCVLCDRCENLSRVYRPLLSALARQPEKTASAELRVLHESAFLLGAELDDTCAALGGSGSLPHVRGRDGKIVPRVAAIAEDYLASASYQFSESGLATYVEAFQKIDVLKMAELWALIPAVKLILLEQIGESGRRLLQDPAGSYPIHHEVRSLQDLKQTTWKDVIEPLIVFDQVLRQDPAGAYAQMDYESRELYRRKIVNIAERSDCSELEVAREVLVLARRARKEVHTDPRVTLRTSHVGFYLLAEGVDQLEKKTHFRPKLGERIRTWLRQRPDEFYLPGIAILTFAIISVIVFLLTSPATALVLVLLSILVVFLPSSQAAVQIMNYLTTMLLPAQILPKLDFSEGIPDDCVSMVAIPTLLLNEKQVQKLAVDLEVRYLGNHDPNLHFMLLTDLPDSAEEPSEENPLVDLCEDLINALNKKYAAKRMGSFFMLHRHPVYNPREGFWMGWERKRGKLMDLNNLISGQFDSFPVKVGDLTILSNVRFVITLDTDTELPRGSARRMVGALAHPLNQAIIDPERGIVTTGYGILQPRVGVSVQSSARSRLASIQSGQAGLDIYTRAASDVYQDLYGEGIFVGKGIYEVKPLHHVLDRRFPRNALLSHDLVEGAHARAGLVSDIEVIEDYPSHYSAYNRRKHRWLRGDWQITEWLLPLVPEESGQRVPNPLSVVSRWKILDNLRRSLVEPASFLLLVLGWIILPAPAWAWTLAYVVILFLPALCQLAVDAFRAAISWQHSLLSAGLNSFLDASITNCLTITFLAHQALLSIDAVIRTIVRRLITRQRLLQWETAAEAEINGQKRTALDVYQKWTPLLALALFALVWSTRRPAISAAIPILLLWALSNPIALWLNEPSRAPRKQASERDRWLLRLAALRTWRYFAEFSTKEHHWLIPDNVQEDDLKIAPRISPTNLGFLFNARQVACELGYVTVPEFAQQTLRTLATVSKLPRHRGHLFNWYDTQSLVPLAPTFVSTVDSGNLLASLWTLQRGCLDLLNQPLLQPESAQGFLDHLYLLTTLSIFSRRNFSAIKTALRRGNWLRYLLDVPDDVLKDIHQAASHPKLGPEDRWFQEQVEERIRQVNRTVQMYTPWLLPEFSGLGSKNAVLLEGHPDDLPVLQRMPALIDDLTVRLQSAGSSEANAEANSLSRQLLALLPDARSRVVRLIDDLKRIAEECGELADGMDFKFLLQRNRQLLSVGFDVDTKQLQSACYDLLASEARTAFFAAIAKDDIRQESWFLLGRPPIVDQGIAGLLSWTGTMFEYLMPALWMKTYPNTLLERAEIVAVQAQRAYASQKRISWGISECAYSRKDEAGNYQYRAFGVPLLALHKPDQYGPVVSPYSTFLALNIDPGAALENLRKLERMGSVGPYGFYEALDFSPVAGRSGVRRYESIRCWMAHHQGMSLLSLGNCLREGVVRKWFHSHPRVQATELLLQEKPADPAPSLRQRTPAA
jgi:hypothetical protein